ncbi:MAG: hypothetical protein JWM91_5464 [Rhodospirillales bacterium]|nr:hypothetical protein [Rhodospirillales bacterium]
MRRIVPGLALLMVWCGVAAAETFSPGPKAEATQWAPTERSLIDLIEHGYKLVSVLHANEDGGVIPGALKTAYYLQGDKIAAKCLEVIYPPGEVQGYKYSFTCALISVPHIVPD